VAEKLLIVHGYSDGSTSFTGLGDFLVAQGLYKPEHVYYLDYSSMDDQSTFRDFADKLDNDHRTRLKGERVDVACHSTGSLVVRAWLTLHAERTSRRQMGGVPCPIDRLLCFAPANFGSDLAALGQSFLGKFRTTFFNRHSRPEDFLESGKAVLQGLEPASPFQWELSCYDLHGPSTYFSADPNRPNDRRCFPMVFAAGEAYTGVEAQLIKQRAMLGTDGTVRIPGTSLNTRGCSLDCRDGEARLVWWPACKYDDIPFCVFAGFNHGSIIDPKHPRFTEPDGPGTLAVNALTSVHDLASFEKQTTVFTEACTSNYKKMPADRQDPFQQFFFRVRDDVDQIVEDYYIDFHVARRDGSAHHELTVYFDEQFETHVYRHSAARSHRVFLMNCGRLHEFHQRLIEDDAVLMIEVAGASSLPDVQYDLIRFVAFDPKAQLAQGEPWLLVPNTTTLVDVILNRRQSDRLLVIKDSQLTVVIEAEITRVLPPSGRAELVVREREESERVEP